MQVAGEEGKKQCDWGGKRKQGRKSVSEDSGSNGSVREDRAETKKNRELGPCTYPGA